MDDELEAFLHGRGLQDSAIQRIKTEKIDIDAINLLDEDTLSKYVPIAGDRIMLREFCIRQSAKQTSSKKLSLFTILKEKMNSFGQCGGDSDKTSSPDRSLTRVRKGKHNAAKFSRRIELGWIHDGRALRTAKGGGTRKLSMPKTCMNTDICEMGKQIFFRNGSSVNGNIEQFDCKVLDFQKVPMPDGVTIGDVYEVSKMGGILRFYFATTTGNDEAPDSPAETSDDISNTANSSVLEETILPGPCLSTPTPAALADPLAVTSRFNSNMSLPSPDQSIDQIHNDPIHYDIVAGALPVCIPGKPVDNSLGQHNRVKRKRDHTIVTSSDENAATSSHQSIELPKFLTTQERTTSESLNINSLPLNEQTLNEQFPELVSTREKSRKRSISYENESAGHDSLQDSNQLGATAFGSCMDDNSTIGEIPFVKIPELSDVLSSDDHIDLMELDYSDFEVTFAPMNEDTVQNMDDTLPLQASPPDPIPQTLRVHRGHVLDDLIEHFKNPSLDPQTVHFSIDMVLPNGLVEGAEDTGGVLRDCLTEFWEEFYQRCTIGTDSKVPCTRHDFEDVHWLAIAKVIFMGWKQEQYFPIQMSKAFFQNCIFGISSSNITDDYLQTISKTDRDVLVNALADFSSVPEDELLEVLDSLDCKKQATSENFRNMLKQMAHKFIIQDPHFVIIVWRELLPKMNITISEFGDIFESLKPTVRRVLKMIEFPDDMAPNNSTSKHLQRFIKDLDESLIAKFLRFVTGSDLAVKNKIFIRFVNLQGFARRPVAHTCGCVLELPQQYENYLAFKSEFLSVLQNPVWVMDII